MTVRLLSSEPSQTQSALSDCVGIMGEGHRPRQRLHRMFLDGLTQATQGIASIAETRRYSVDH